VYEVQELKVDLGTQVQAGQLLGVLSNHATLYIAGHAFKREATPAWVKTIASFPFDEIASEDGE
jgi:hypothetical protein